MIVTFSVSNFRSFAEEQSLSLVASNRFAGSHESHAVSIPDSDSRVLRIGIVYGANGAGKSNLFTALKYLRRIALEPRKKGQPTGRQPNRFAPSGAEPTLLDIQFIASDRLFRYGIVLDDDQVVEEWLVQVIGNREKDLYSRTTDDLGNVSIDLKPALRHNKKLGALAMVGGLPNQSFLATIRATLKSSEYGDALAAVIGWFDEDLAMVEPDSSFVGLPGLLDKNSFFQEFASRFLRAASTGVDRLKVQKEALSEEQLQSTLGGSTVWKRLADSSNSESPHMVQVSPNRVILRDPADDKQFYSLSIQSVHEHETGQPVELDIDEESDGTQRLLNLIPALHYLHTNGGVFVIDEIDRSMHPLLIWKFVEFFLNACAGERRQMIVTTHEANLLDLDLLRRDEIWFAEKDQRGGSRLYSLAEFNVRKDLKIQKHYLQGRFGAVPFLGDVDRLMEREHALA